MSSIGVGNSSSCPLFKHTDNNAPGVNDVTGQSVAIKLQHESRSLSSPALQQEVYLLHDLTGGIGIPQVYWAGEEGTYYAMAFELLGPSLEDLFNFCGRRFSLKTVLMLANQILHRIEFVHSKRILTKTSSRETS